MRAKCYFMTHKHSYMSEDIKLLSVEDLENFEKQFHSREVEDYMAAVSEISCSNSSEVFNNSGNVHAAIIFSHIFSKSKSIVRILAGNMYNVVTMSKMYQDALLAFLGRENTQLQILLSSTDLNKVRNKPIPNSLFKKLQPYASKIIIKQTEKTLRRNNEIVHLCTGDQSMYRLEVDPRNRHAEVCLNDADYVRDYLIPVFDRLFQSEDAIACQCETVYN